MKPIDPDWTSPKTGHDWRDDTTLLACAWLEALADQRKWAARLEATGDWFANARAARLRDEHAPLYDPRDAAAWYIFQARAYAQDRSRWVPEEAVRIVPTLVRLGTELELLLSIPGAEDIGRRIMNGDRSQPDDGLFELLVALAYKRGGWDVAFVPPVRGGPRSHDINISRGRSRWAVECKRMARSAEHVAEAARGRVLAAAAHARALDAYRSISMTVAYYADPAEVPDDWLAARVDDYLTRPWQTSWRDDYCAGTIEEIDFSLARRIMAEDDVYYASSRMIEMLIGEYDHQLDHSMIAKWRPSASRPSYAEMIYQASVVRWAVVAGASTIRKAKHFRWHLVKAVGQMPGDRPGVIHVGVESWAGDVADYYRHIQNRIEAMEFRPEGSRLRWVYGNYIVPELTTRSDESWALSETMAPYRVGRHSVREPLPGHLLLTPEDDARDGVHWDGKA